MLSTPFHSCLVSSNVFSWISFSEGDAQFCLFSPLHPISLHFCLRQSQESLAQFLSWLHGSNWLPHPLGQWRRVWEQGLFLCTLWPDSNGLSGKVSLLSIYLDFAGGWSRSRSWFLPLSGWRSSQGMNWLPRTKYHSWLVGVFLAMFLHKDGNYMQAWSSH